MDMIAAFNDVGSYRGAAAICGVDHKTVQRALLGRARPGPAGPPAGTTTTSWLTSSPSRVAKTSARIIGQTPPARGPGRGLCGLGP